MENTKNTEKRRDATGRCAGSDDCRYESARRREKNKDREPSVPPEPKTLSPDLSRSPGRRTLDPRARRPKNHQMPPDAKEIPAQTPPRKRPRPAASSPEGARAHDQPRGRHAGVHGVGGPGAGPAPARLKFAGRTGLNGYLDQWVPSLVGSVTLCCLFGLPNIGHIKTHARSIPARPRSAASGTPPASPSAPRRGFDGMRWYALACAGMRWHALACRWHALTCAGTRWHAAGASMRADAQTCTRADVKMRRRADVHVCLHANVYACGVHMHASVHVYACMRACIRASARVFGRAALVGVVVRRAPILWALRADLRPAFRRPLAPSGSSLSPTPGGGHCRPRPSQHVGPVAGAPPVWGVRAKACRGKWGATCGAVQGDVGWVHMVSIQGNYALARASERAATEADSKGVGVAVGASFPPPRSSWTSPATFARATAPRCSSSARLGRAPPAAGWAGRGLRGSLVASGSRGSSSGRRDPPSVASESGGLE